MTLQAHKFASAFWHLKAARTLELSSDTDLATDSKDAFQVSQNHAAHANCCACSDSKQR